MSQPTATPDPGWYPDAADPALERWWDGADWSPVTRPGPAGRDAATPLPVTPPAANGQAPAANGQAPAAEGADGRANPYPPLSNPYAAPPADRGPAGAGEPPRQHPQSGPQPGLQSGLQPGLQPGPVGGRAPGTGPTTPDGVPLASPWLRLVARFADTVITSVLTLAAGAYYAAQMMNLARPEFEAVAAGTPGADLSRLLDDPAFTGVMLRYTFVGLLVGGVYSVVLTHLLGATVGKLMVGIRVRSWDEAGRPTWGQALARWLTREVIAQISFGGIGTIYWIMDTLWLLFDPRRQCLHDKLPGTVVVRHR